MSNIKLITTFLEAIKKNADNTEIKNFKIGDSKIHGKGVMAGKKMKNGDYINVALYKTKNNIYDTTQFGAHLNHSYQPNARTRNEGDFYRTYAIADINPNDEITVDYTKNKELEQPGKDWS